MYSFDKSLEAELNFLIGSELGIIQIDQWNILLTFFSERNDDISINVSGIWELTNVDESILDTWNQGGSNAPSSAKESYKIQKLLGKKVIDVQVVNPDALSVKFEGDYSFKIYDRDKQYECCNISWGSKSFII